MAVLQKGCSKKPTYNYLHLLAKLQARMGDFKNAVMTARRASELAVEKKLTEFVHLNNQLIAEWEKKL